jgi:O-acetyl-ADP-ribose deacetylase (regulator of RNase III)
MKMANSSFSSLNELVTPDKTEAVFTLGSAYHNCEVRIYRGNVCDFNPGHDLGATICWTNECCDLSLDDGGKNLLNYGGRNLDKDISSLPGITQTPWGIAKCGTGNAVIVGPGNYDDLRVHCVILAVGPMSASCDDVYEATDEDSLHYITVMMRSCIRSSLILSKHSQVQSIAFPTLTSKMGGPTYEQTLLTNLKIIVEEAKHSDLNTLHIVTKTDEEASKLIGMAMELGLTMHS